ncbi:polyadenylate-binding protein-interacting protein 12-like [Apium graveolens]|uniref:polyadenylate-binding protein-interacting protein 12-like n=1 Tax=Apium graveolens TaxID=4045 RepID=UPI003D794776
MKKDCPAAAQASSRGSVAASNRVPTARTFNMTVKDTVRNTNVIAGVSLSSLSRTVIMVNPETPESKKLKSCMILKSSSLICKFVEFTDEDGARNALNLACTMLGFYPVKVLPSKTAIAHINPTFLPRSKDEREMYVRTIYYSNIDKKVTPADVKLFFETVCGEVLRLRLLEDYHHSTRIAFVEFVMNNAIPNSVPPETAQNLVI